MCSRLEVRGMWKGGFSAVASVPKTRFKVNTSNFLNGEGT